MGRGSRPSEGYEAINKRFVVNKLANISAGCSFFYHSPREQNSPASFLQANKYPSRSPYLHSKQGEREGTAATQVPCQEGTMYGPKENGCAEDQSKCSFFSQGDDPGQGSAQVQGSHCEAECGVLCAMQVCRAPGHVLPTLPFYTLCLTAH